MALYVNGNFELPPNIEELEQELISDFQNTDKNWCEGRLKSSFNYLLLDPRVTNNLPLRYPQMTELEVFTVFLSGIFYVGKGKRNRPYAHFNEALHHMKADTEKQVSVKHVKVFSYCNISCLKKESIFRGFARRDTHL